MGEVRGGVLRGSREEWWCNVFEMFDDNDEDEKAGED